MGLGSEDVSLLELCPHFRGCYVQASMELGPEDVSLLEMCPHFKGCYIQASMGLGPEVVSLLEGCYVQTSMNLKPEDMSPLECALMADISLCLLFLQVPAVDFSGSNRPSHTTEGGRDVRPGGRQRPGLPVPLRGILLTYWSSQVLTVSVHTVEVV